MSKFCVGQKVINRFNRQGQTVTAIYPNGKLVLDNTFILHLGDVQCEADFLDRTNYFYHHSKFADGVTFMEEGQRERSNAVEDVAELTALQSDSVFIMKAITMAEERITAATEKQQRGVAWCTTAQANMKQWQGKTLDHHFPFVNPENVIDY